MRLLYVTTIGGTMRFFQSLVRELLDRGHSVDIATNELGGGSPVPACYREWGCEVHSISCTRSPLDPGNLRAVREIRDIVARGSYDVVHCHTPIAAACTRLACRRLRREGVRVIYTAHGFHFYDGAPLANWVLYYPVEKALARHTDVLVTINAEDYERARRRFHAGRVVYVPGVGVDTSRFGDRPARTRERIRAELGIGENERMLLSVGELNRNKNHEAVVRAVAGTDIRYVVVGQGGLADELERIAADDGTKLTLTGYRDDVADIYAAADAYVLPSLREGLNVSLMEAMASGLPCAVSDIRGNRDLVDEEGGTLFDPRDVGSVREGVEKVLLGNPESMGRRNRNHVAPFSSGAVIGSMITDVYRLNGVVNRRS